MKRMFRRIRYKIVAPFTLLLVAATVLTAVISATLVSGSLEARFTQQIEEASEMVAQTDFALNRLVLENFKAVLDAIVKSIRNHHDVEIVSPREPRGEPPGSSIRFPVHGPGGQCGGASR